ncbi:hypothetical protein [Halanaerobaculum tunisiense]
MSLREDFISAIKNKKLVEIVFDSKEKGRITRKCVPFDFGPSRKYKDKRNRFHFHDLNSPEGSHVLSILPGQLVDLKILEKSFKPGNYVHWEPNWFVDRDWGQYS